MVNPWRAWDNGPLVYTNYVFARPSVPSAATENENITLANIPHAQLDVPEEGSQSSLNQSGMSPGANQRVASDTTIEEIRDQYLYESLQDTETIRLLLLEPGEGEDLLRCSIRPANIHDTPPYEALSYAWGETIKIRVIECHGKRLAITRNLHDALQHIRSADRPRLIWADAVCINQDDPIEMGHQVRMMRSVYQTADRVLVWLGRDDKRYARSAFQLARSLVVFNWSPSSDDPSWTHLAALFSQPYWWRVWVIQEICLSKSALVIWGSARTLWQWIRSAAVYMRLHCYDIKRKISIPGVYNAYLMHRLSAEDLGSVSFMRLLSLTRQFKATDQRDRVYSLLGLPTTDAAPAEGPLFLQPDYTKSVAQLYYDLARKLLKSAKTLQVLSAVQHGPVIEHRPSWVPRWDLFYTHTLALPDVVRPNFDACAGISTQATWSDFGDHLSLKGVRFDAVEKVSETLPQRRKLVTNITYFSPIWALMNSQPKSYPTGEPLEKAFCWTITAGKHGTGWLVDDRYGHATHMNDCAAFMRHLELLLSDNSACIVSGDGANQSVPLSASLADGDGAYFAEAASIACGGRRFFLTSKGYMGIGSSALLEGDIVCVLFGGAVPFILRPESAWYVLIGEAYVHGTMHGEVVEGRQDTDVEYFELR